MAGKRGPTRGRRECSHEVRTKLRTYLVEIRFDRHKGDFFTKFGGREFINPSINGLKEDLLEEASKADNVVWERWIQYELIEGGYSNYRRYQDANTPVVGLRFDCVELSIPQAGVARRHVARTVDDEGNVEPLDERWIKNIDTFLGTIWDKRGKIIRFTPERWVALRQVQMAILEARKKLGRLLDADEPADVENRLDSMTAPLLVAGAPEDENE